MKNSKSLSIVSSILFIIVGLIVFLKPNMIVMFISYFVGGLLIAVGIYKSVNYYIHDKNLGVVNSNEIAFGISAIVLGLLFIFLAGAIELLLRFIIGGWLLFAGISKLSKTFYTTERNANFYSLIIIGFLFMAAGLYIILVSNLALSIIGLFMVLYGVINLISLFISKDSLNNENDRKQIDVAEAEIIEETAESEEDNKTKKTKKSKKS